MVISYWIRFLKMDEHRAFNGISEISSWKSSSFHGIAHDSSTTIIDGDSMGGIHQ